MGIGGYQVFELYEKSEILDFKYPSALFPITEEGKRGGLPIQRSHSGPLMYLLQLVVE